MNRNDALYLSVISLLEQDENPDTPPKVLIVAYFGGSYWRHFGVAPNNQLVEKYLEF